MSSPWSAPPDDTPPLAGERTADVCVIGAGIAGLTAAYLLAKAGSTVVVLERGRLGAGETLRTTAHLTCVLDTRYRDLIKTHGTARARLALRSHQDAIATCERIAADEGIDCAFTRVDGYLFAHPEAPADLLTQERDACQKIGLAVTLQQQPPLRIHEGPALQFADQAHLDAGAYYRGLLAAARRHGATFHSHSAARELDEREDGCTVKTDNGRVHAQHVIVATNAPVFDSAHAYTKQVANQTYAIAVRVPPGSVPDALAWDTPDPASASPAYHYVRLLHGDGRDLLIVGGEDHQTGTADDGSQRIASLVVWTRERFPHSGEVVHAWSGEIMEPSDGLALIGTQDKHGRVLIATGTSGNGMTYGTIAGRLLADLVRGLANPLAAVYDPRRTRLRSIPTLVADTARTAGHLVERALPKGRTPALAPGDGVVVQRGTTKLAVSSADDGSITTRSAICTHLGCVVHWNSFDRTWDCPCHGSRFAADGAVLHGPARTPLEPVDE